jgi:FtsH-binding integral membrane protein
MNMRNAFSNAAAIEAEQASFISKVYGWMTLALAVSGLVASWTASTPAMVEAIFGNSIVFFGLIIGEVICVMYLVSVIGSISGRAATAMFLLYAVLNGLTLAVIFVVYTAESIALTFFITAGTFGVMSAYGYFTKTDLTTIGNLAMMALVGLIIASIVNWFLQSEAFYWITTYAGILIFTGLTAYDTQKIKNLNVIGNEGTDEDRKEAIMGALTLYLDFINLFLMLLRLFGRRK